ncbi:type II secretion system GspH family protein [Robertmurraya korlensis]|uniref:type II secretion system protein n=1 Tax=Robertmurraya korlensis TaxID=519977 RepID=UPI00203A3E4A|nr:prepilin-type N-terminal cleavage/methylation domain-containing protein [Robertmurraya korlensis]MCM3603023.1 type II secretion system GspH family protein [Robertmurraya korlensis]
MLKSLKKKMKDQAGLTLIELLVVIVILGIIAAVAIPMVMSNKDDAAKNTNAQNLSVLQDAVNRYYTLEDEYPAALTTLKGDYIDEVPTVKTFGSCTGSFGLDATGEKVIITSAAMTTTCTK